MYNILKKVITTIKTGTGRAKTIDLSNLSNESPFKTDTRKKKEGKSLTACACIALAENKRTQPVLNIIADRISTKCNYET